MENRINHIIARVLSGESSSDDILSLSEWLNENEKNRDEFRRLKNYWDADVAFKHSVAPAFSADKLQQKINVQKRQTFRRQLWRNAIPLIAAACLLFIFSTGFFLYNTNDRTSEYYTLLTDEHKSNFTMEDGTVITLNKNSRLSYSDKYGKDSRNVKLEGEAYFEVAKDAKKPFIVQAGEIDVEVLGTSFNVNSYSSGEFVRTALLNGSVKISGKTIEEPVYLKPNELFEYRKIDRVSSVEDAKAALYADWIKDRLVFDKDYLSDILISMEGRYNMDIECPEKFAASIRLSFTIRNESIEEVMEAMSLIAPIKYEIKGKKVYIIPKK